MNAPEHLSDRHDVAAFDCGNADLNRWLHDRARASEGKTARTLVVTVGQKVVAYYCLAAGAVARRDLPSRLRHNTPEQIPVILIGRLAVDVAYQGLGLGKGLLRDAILRAMTASEMVGARALVVHAIDDDAARFYRKYGFHPSPLDARSLVLPLGTAREAVAD